MDRYYESFGVTLRESTVETLLLWNTDAEHKGQEHDFLFTQIILIELFGVGALVAGELYDAKKNEFIRKCFSHRVESDPARSGKLSSYIQQAILQMRFDRDGANGRENQLSAKNIGKEISYNMAQINIDSDDHTISGMDEPSNGAHSADNTSVQVVYATDDINNVQKGNEVHSELPDTVDGAYDADNLLLRENVSGEVCIGSF